MSKLDKTERETKVGETRFHYGKNRREICVDDGKVGNSSISLDGERWMDYDSDEAKQFHFRRLEDLLLEHYSLSHKQLVEMLEIHYPEKLV